MASSMNYSTSSSLLLQGPMKRDTRIGDPKTLAHYYNTVSNLVSSNQSITQQRTYSLKRRHKASYYGYESVLNRKKRLEVRPAIPYSNPNKYVRPPTSYNIEPEIQPLPVRGAISNPALQTPVQRVAFMKPAPRPVSYASSKITSAATAVPQRLAETSVVGASPKQTQSGQSNPGYLKRSDYRIGATVMIRHTADLVACGARQLVSKTGRIVTVPQGFGQELYSVYIDEHEALFHVPFNSLVLVNPSRDLTTTTQAQVSASPAPSVLLAQNVRYPQQVTNNASNKSSNDEVKLEHSLQLHRLMQQQYREIQVLQQQYAESRVVNPAALPAIQKELSKLRLVHLAQVQTLKSKQALDLLGKQ